MNIKGGIMERKTLFMSTKIWARLQVIAEDKGATISDLIRRAVAEFLERMEGK